jgi:hypothetical protein
MQKGLAWFTIFFGAICMTIAMLHILFGPPVIPGSVPVNATMDSEDRFYATLFLGFGATLIWCGRDLGARGQAFGALLIVFLVGGLARIFSVLAVGMPHPLFQFLGLLELAMPPLLWWWYRSAFAKA